MKECCLCRFCTFEDENIFFISMKSTSFFYLFFALLLTITISCSSEKRKSQKESEKHEPTYLYDILIDTLSVEKGTVEKNQFLSDILSEKNVSYNVIDHIARNHKKVFDVRKMKVGNNYTFLLTNDTLSKALYFIYEIDYTDYVVFGLTDSLPAWRGKKEVVRKLETASGTISSSLWNSMMDGGYDPNLSNKLSEVYAWTIDFFGIQEGDHYDVIYERLYVDGEPIAVGKIMASRFNHFKKDQLAFYFVQDSVGDYFDEKGQSLMRSFLKAPLKYSRISSKFTHSRKHPILKISRPHHGVDYAAPAGTPVYAIGDGVVTRKGYQKAGGGNYLYIKHNGIYTTAYMHLKSFAKGIAQGVRVKQGQLIGYVGSTGLSTGPHLDFRFFKNGTPVDPLKVESPPEKPVQDSNKAQYEIEVAKWMDELQKLKKEDEFMVIQEEKEK